MTISSEQSNLSTTKTKGLYVDVFEHPMVRRWMVETAKRKPIQFSLLVRDNQETFKEIFQQPYFVEKNKKKPFSRWRFSAKGFNWMIQSGVEGSIFRIAILYSRENFTKDARSGTGIIDFLNELMNKIECQ